MRLLHHRKKKSLSSTTAGTTNDTSRPQAPKATTNTNKEPPKKRAAAAPPPPEKKKAPAPSEKRKSPPVVVTSSSSSNHGPERKKTPPPSPVPQAPKEPLKPTTKPVSVVTTKEVSLKVSLANVAKLLKQLDEEGDLTASEVALSIQVYKELKRVLTPESRMGDDTLPPQDRYDQATNCKERYEILMSEFNEAESSQYVLQNSNPAVTRPLSLQGLQQEVDDFFILDNSLRETTVGAPGHHTLAEKKQILGAVAESGLEEVALGAFGSKSGQVQGHMTQHWRNLGKTLDCAWGFSDAYDFDAFDEEGLWDFRDFCKKEKQGADLPELFTPPSKVKTKYSEEDRQFLLNSSKGFRSDAFRRRTLDSVLRESESKRGRIPMGCLMMAGYGVCNVILEIDAAVEPFDYKKYDVVARLVNLIRWCKRNLPERRDVARKRDRSPRVLINLRDFANWRQSRGGLEVALRIVDELSRLPSDERPFGFMIEEPTNYLFPNEVARLCRMIRLTMQRAGFSKGRFLVHQHRYFGLAEANVLAALCNGADGVWAAVCKAGAQVGHASSTVTAVNLYRAGNKFISRKYNLRKMCKAARRVTELTTRKPCPEYEEVYGAKAFDIPYFMMALPTCRYSVMVLIAELGIHERIVRLNEHSLVSSVYNAMVSHFGPPNEGGWDPQYCESMHQAIRDHLVHGLSRNYNSSTGLGHLYQLVSRRQFSPRMIQLMMERSSIPDHHPSVIEFVCRWNRLCEKYEDRDSHLPGYDSKSVMVLSTEAAWRPRLLVLPFEYLHADILRNNASESIPRLFEYQVLNSLTKQERERQRVDIPEVYFYDMLVRLKLFLEEASDLGVLPLVDDFCLRYNRDCLMGDQLILGRNSESNVLRDTHLAVFSRFYQPTGDNAMNRLVISTDRDAEMRTLPTFVGMKSDLEQKRNSLRRRSSTATPELVMTPTHEEMIRDLINYQGEDPKSNEMYFEKNKEALDLYTADNKLDAEIYVKEESSILTSASEVSDVSDLADNTSSEHKEGSGSGKT